MSREYQYSDVDIDFNKNEFINDVSVKKDRNAIRQSVTNIILTRPGEKPFNRSFGVGVHDMLFENWTDVDVAILEQKVAAQLGTWEPRALLEWIEIDDNLIDTNEISMVVNYVVLTGIEKNPIRESIRIGLVKVR